MNASGLEEGYAREAVLSGDGEGEGGRGCWIEREGRESLVACQFLYLEIRIGLEIP